MRISIFGLGYVGSVAAACLAKRGHEVVGVDVLAEKVALMNAGEAQISEPGLEERIQDGLASGRLRATTQAADAVRDTEVSIVCVGTPSAEDGSINLRHVEAVVAQIAIALMGKETAHPHIVILRSTMVPGTTRRLAEEVFARTLAAGRMALYFYPEFLRQGTAIADFEDPSIAVVGCADPEAPLGILEALLDPEIVRLDFEAAELVKYACNAFHATKVAFANEIGRMAKHLQVDGRKVMEAVCSDTVLNISPYYLRPGNPFGGSCLPKDVAALSSMAASSGISIPMLDHVLPSNRAHVDHLFDMLASAEEVVMLGLSFKRDTDDLRGSPMVEVAARLLAEGRTLRLYDPWLNLEKLMGASKALVAQKLPGLESLMHQDCAAAVGERGTVVVSNQCVNLDDLQSALGPQHDVIDVNGWPALQELEVSVRGICW